MNTQMSLALVVFVIGLFLYALTTAKLATAGLVAFGAGLAAFLILAAPRTNVEWPWSVSLAVAAVGLLVYGLAPDKISTIGLACFGAGTAAFLLTVK